MTSDRAATPFKALLVEGTSGAGKSTLIDALIRRHVGASQPRKIRSLIHLAQSHTYGPLAAGEDTTLTAEENICHLEGIVRHMEWLHASVQEHTRPWCFVLVDTLHLTHCMRPGVVKWDDVSRFDERMAALGCRLLFLEVSPSAIWERGIKPRMEEQFIREYARKFGRTHEEIHQYFVREQDEIAKLFSHSSMPKLLLRNEGAADSMLDTVYQFWTQDA